MKRFLCIFVLIFFLTGCSSMEVPIYTSEIVETNKVKSEMTTTHLPAETQRESTNVVELLEDVNIQSEEERAYLINSVAFWLKEMTGEEFSEQLEHEQYFIDLRGKTVYRSEEMVSVIFQGMINLESAAHPLNVFFSFNYHPNTLETIVFSELHSVTEKLYLAFASEGEKTIREENGGAWPQSLDSFSEVFCSKERFFNGLKENCPIDQRIYFYYAGDNIGFSFSTPYVLGGHKEIELPRPI